jgi:[acyl-carrier-protein] S-malonyltransferase
MQIVLLFPGQGSQKPGMGKALAEAFPEARAVFEQIDDALNAPLSTLCFEGPAEELTQTRNAQPALFAHGAAAWATVVDAIGAKVVAAAGHSLGEHTAYYASGAVTLTHGAWLVRRRGEIMHEVGVDRPGTMAAILGTLTRPIDDVCAQASAEAGLVVAANYNTAEQTVVSGELAGVERAMELAKEAGARRALKLTVSGAFHSPLMAPAEPALADAIADAELQDPNFPIYSNVTAQPSTSAATAKDTLLRQLTAPVQWVESVRHMAATYPHALYVELGPGNVLSGLVSRIVPGAATIHVGAPADVDKLMDRIAHHAAHHALSA